MEELVEHSKIASPELEKILGSFTEAKILTFSSLKYAVNMDLVR
jgi:hypothetical protein